MHSLRRAIASRALLAGESADEVAFLLGHRDATVTRVVYIHEIAAAHRQHPRRSAMTAEYAAALRVAAQSRQLADRRSSAPQPVRRSTSASTPVWGGGALLSSFQMASMSRAWTASQAPT
jgi:hypothetical protein